MQIIIISKKDGRHRHWHFNPMLLAFIAVGMFSLITFAAMGIQAVTNTATERQIDQDFFFQSSIGFRFDQPQERLFGEEHINDFYAKQLGGLQAETLRLRALSERLAEIAGFDLSEYALDATPGLGGIEAPSSALDVISFQLSVDRLSESLALQDQVLLSLQDVLVTTDAITSAIPQGSPVDRSWISSFYGNRLDPFSGRRAFHRGVDFAGREGTPVKAVADGIVSWSGPNGHYGELIEIDHGNGYMTRYAHNKVLKAKTGDRVSKGEIIALMGSTGRSTASHLHFEVFRDGKSVNPYQYLK